jgi:hypothetical protein
VKFIDRQLKSLVYVALVVGFGGEPVRASCYGWNPGDISTINLEDKENGYYRIWKNRKNIQDKNNLQLVAKLRHGSKIKVIKFIEGDCGGDVYLETKVKGRAVRGWTDSDELTYRTNSSTSGNYRPK